ncbi:MAG: hypothetical protein JST30_00105 [Armatimonadetes bacterium]|nr:hypothetical protein [Armatimonadota bacterium]
MLRARGILTTSVSLVLAGACWATTRELIDFSILPGLPAENVRSGSLAVEDYPLPVVDNAGAAAYDHTQSLVFERKMEEGSVERPLYKKAVLTYPLGQNSFTFPMPDHEISLWLHIDGPPSVSPGASPFSQSEVRPEMVRICLKGQGKTYYSARQQVSRGWNELRFCLTSKVYAPRCPDSFNNRIVQFSPEDESGTFIDTVQLVFDGTYDCAASYSVGKIRLNTCKLQPVRPCSIVMVYDDAWSGFLDYAYPTVKALKMPVTVAAVRDYAVGPAPFHMSVNDLQAVFGYNYLNPLGAKTFLVDIVNHTATHFRLHGDTPALRRNYRTSSGMMGVYDDIFEGRRFLIDNKLTRNASESFLIYPGGASDAQVYMAMEQIGIRFGRTVSCERNQNAQGDSLRNPFAGETYDACRAENNVDIFQSQHPVEELFDWIDEGIQTGRNRFIMWHDVMPALPEFDVNGRAADGYHTVYNVNSLAFHDQVLAYIQAKRGPRCSVRTLPAWYQSLSDLQKIPGFHL